MSINTEYGELAKVLTQFSTNLQAGEQVLIDASDIPDTMVLALIRAVRACGAIPHVSLKRSRISRELVRAIDTGQFETEVEWELQRMQQMDAYIAFEDQIIFLKCLMCRRAMSAVRRKR